MQTSQKEPPLLESSPDDFEVKTTITLCAKLLTYLLARVAQMEASWKLASLTVRFPLFHVCFSL